ncbi:hypothetical protein ACIA5D_43685 [Actinoplanes sp. NPDC051513]|uniref:hypothetical protein n=1 Tax=Actinoplanes sp. NPDC051513 TaxID=3363908 RepID=UPI0037BD6229
MTASIRNVAYRQPRRSAGRPCTTAEARRRRQALCAAASAPGRRYSLLMIGSGAVNDPLDRKWGEDVGIEIDGLLRRRQD